MGADANGIESRCRSDDHNVMSSCSLPPSSAPIREIRGKISVNHVASEFSSTPGTSWQTKLRNWSIFLRVRKQFSNPMYAHR